MERAKSPTPTIEDYLGIIYTLDRDGEDVYGARLAEILNVSPPTVTVTLQRMVRDHWITLDQSKKVHLTAGGKSAAHNLIRRHMLTEWMLSKILNLPWSEIHNEADKIEHTISSDVERSLQITLEDPEMCPHGNPMPGAEGISQNWKPLTSFELKKPLVIRRIHEFLEEDQELMRFLETNCVTPGIVCEIGEILQFNKTMTVIIKGHSVILGLDIAQSIFAEPV